MMMKSLYATSNLKTLAANPKTTDEISFWLPEQITKLLPEITRTVWPHNHIPRKHSNPEATMRLPHSDVFERLVLLILPGAQIMRMH